MNVCYFFITQYTPHRGPPSFPTRRSSDLGAPLVGNWNWSAAARGAGVPVARAKPATRNPTAKHVFFRPEEINRSEEHTSELQSPCNLVCRLLLEKKNNN